MRRHMMHVNYAVAAACSLMMGTNDACADRVVRRGGLEHVDGRVTTIDDEGVTIQRVDQIAELVRWDRVADVIMDKPDAQLARHLETAEQLWRARARLERHDFAMAEPLLERLFESYRGQKGETALLVAEGLLRCRLARAAHDAAVIPALESARLRRAIDGKNVYSTLGSVIDATTSLCPALAPTWAAGHADSSLTRLLRDLESYDARGDAVIAAIAAQYFRALQSQLGTALAVPPAQKQIEHPGIALLTAWNELSSADEPRRAQVRDRLLRDVASFKSWQQAWVHYAIGNSLCEDQNADAARRQTGMITMLRVPAQFAHEQPYLAGLALARVAVILERAGDLEGANTLRAELERDFPNHPAARAIHQRAWHTYRQATACSA